MGISSVVQSLSNLHQVYLGFPRDYFGEYAQFSGFLLDDFASSGVLTKFLHVPADSADNFAFVGFFSVVQRAKRWNNHRFQVVEQSREGFWTSGSGSFKLSDGKSEEICHPEKGRTSSTKAKSGHFRVFRGSSDQNSDLGHG